jgi:hypothetical protein
VDPLALQTNAPSRRMFVVSIRRKVAIRCVGLVLAAICVWTAYAFKYRPVLVNSPGDWDCACGEMYINTTKRVVWNPFRDRQPEIVADSFLSRLRANECAVDDEVCRNALPSHRVSAWKLSFRKDGGDMASLYYKVTKYGDNTPFGPSVGVIALKKASAGWRVVGFDSYF